MRLARRFRPRELNKVNQKKRDKVITANYAVIKALSSEKK